MTCGDGDFIISHLLGNGPPLPLDRRPGSYCAPEKEAPRAGMRQELSLREGIQASLDKFKVKNDMDDGGWVNATIGESSVLESKTDGRMHRTMSLPEKGKGSYRG
jgi:hypothetical protein